MLPDRAVATNVPDAGLPVGVTRMPLKTYPDGRGAFTEVFRNEWQASPLPVQWNLSRNNPNVLRGVQVHARHWDYLCVIVGELRIGLHDLRADAPTRGRSAMVRMNGGELEILVIPPGVAHGLYSPEHSMHLIGVSNYYDPTDHSRCRWNCPELDLAWPCDSPELSSADREPRGYAELLAGYRASTAMDRSNA